MHITINKNFAQEQQEFENTAKNKKDGKLQEKTEIV